MLIRFGCELGVSLPQPTPIICLVSLREERMGDLRGPERVETTPAVPGRLYRDLFGNRCRRFMAPAGDFTLLADATAADSGLPDPVDPGAEEWPVEALPDDCLGYLRGSRYCETDLLSQTAWDLFGTMAPGWGRVQAICDLVHRHIRFDYVQARDTRTAAEASREGVGVCRDFAHLAIAFCRCLNIPARYVNGHLGDIGVPEGGPMDFAAWMAVWLGGRWVVFDPRNNMPRIGRPPVARGRDAADVPLLHSFGPHVPKEFRVWTHPVEAPPG